MYAVAWKKWPGWDDARIAETFGVTTRSLQNWHKQAVEEGPDALQEHRWVPRLRAVKLDGEGQARLTALTCSTVPEGHASWTLDLLTNKLAELHIVDTISRETVRQALKKRPGTLAEQERDSGFFTCETPS